MKGNNACQKEQHSEWKIAVFCIVALGVLLTFNILIFRNSRDSLLKLQEDNMLATAKTVANSLQNFYDREMEELTLYFNEELEEYLEYDRKESLYSVSGQPCGNHRNGWMGDRCH